MVARDPNCQNKAVPADPGCSGVPGFPYTHEIEGLDERPLCAGLRMSIATVSTTKGASESVEKGAY